MRTHGTISCYQRGCRCDACCAVKHAKTKGEPRNWPRVDKRLPKAVRAYLETEPEFFRSPR